ncbi:COG4705 family protein [Acidisoma sp. 7E03]
MTRSNTNPATLFSAFVQSKVPEITLTFWVIKILTTAMGEATSDYLVFHWNPVLAVLLCTGGFLLALVLQFLQTRYVAWIYWLLVAMVAIVGTMAADILHVVIGVPFLLSTIGFALVLGAVFLLWQRSEGTLSIHHVTTRRREAFYWLTVCATFALGTAAGDMTAATLGLGFLLSGFLFLALFLAPAIGFRAFGLNGIFAFWFSYIMTRPLGASFADWAGKPGQMGGEGLGTGCVSITLTLAVLVLVCVLSLPRRNEAIRETRNVIGPTETS